MKNISKPAAIILYLIIISLLLDFKLTRLVDLKQIGLVLIGMLILFLPGYRREEARFVYANQLARCALFASYIQTFILLFLVLSKELEPENLMSEIALNCRPLLYGFCLWVILSNDKKENTAHIEKERSAADKYPTDTAICDAYRKLGLTNREAQLAVQITKGLSNAEIAAALNISETTVKKHVSNIFEKLDVSRREEIQKRLP